LVSLTGTHPFSVLTVVNIRGNDAVTRQFLQLAEAGFADYAKHFVILLCSSIGFTLNRELRFVLDDS
jgi:hypothetical protein